MSGLNRADLAQYLGGAPGLYRRGMGVPAVGLERMSESAVGVLIGSQGSQHILALIHLYMDAGKTAAGAVIVYDQIVNTQHLVILADLMGDHPRKLR